MRFWPKVLVATTFSGRGDGDMAWVSLVLGLGGLTLALNSVQVWFAPYESHVWPWGEISSDPGWGFLAIILILGASVLGGMAVILGLLVRRRGLRTRSRLIAATGIMLGSLPFLLLAYFFVFQLR